MLNKRPIELASARLLAGQEGLRARVDVTDKVDKRMLLILCDNLLQVLEKSGHLTPNIATTRPANSGPAGRVGLLSDAPEHVK